jgi:hypothetical protein
VKHQSVTFYGRTSLTLYRQLERRQAHPNSKNILPPGSTSPKKPVVTSNPFSIPIAHAGTVQEAVQRRVRVVSYRTKTQFTPEDEGAEDNDSGFRFKTVTTLAMALATLLVGSMNSLLYGALSATKKVRVWY